MMTDGMIAMQLTTIEEFHLAQLVEDFIELVDDSRDTADPAVERLAPTPYPDDSVAAAEFASATRDELLDRRLTDARRARADLREFDPDTPPFSDDEALATRDVMIATADVDAWLRTLTAIRLVVATRLGITSDDEQSGDDGRHDVYDWLGYRLELLIEAADEECDLPRS